MNSVIVEDTDKLNDALKLAGRIAHSWDAHVDVMFEHEYMAMVVTRDITRLWIKVPYIGSILTVYYPVSGYMNCCDIGHEDDMGEFFTTVESSDKEQLFWDMEHWFKDHLC